MYFKFKIQICLIFIKNNFPELFLEFKDPRVLDAMMPYLSSYFGNPHSRTHAYGWEAEKAVENAREV